MPNKCKRWVRFDKAELEYIRTHCENSDITLTEMAQYIGCTRSAILYQIKKMGLKNPTFHWTPELDNALMKMVSDGIEIAVIASTCGTTVAAIRFRKSFLMKKSRL